MTLIVTMTLMTTLLGASNAPVLRDADLAAAATPAIERASVQQPAADHFSVHLRCTALASGRVVDCVVLEETRPGLGFGEAALALMSDAEVSPITENGRPVDAAFERTIDFTP